jgi:hypothetical protein
VVQILVVLLFFPELIAVLLHRVDILTMWMKALGKFGHRIPRGFTFLFQYASEKLEDDAVEGKEREFLVVIPFDTRQRRSLSGLWLLLLQILRPVGALILN